MVHESVASSKEALIRKGVNRAIKACTSRWAEFATS